MRLFSSGSHVPLMAPGHTRPEMTRLMTAVAIGFLVGVLAAVVLGAGPLRTAPTPVPIIDLDAPPDADEPATTDLPTTTEPATSQSPSATAAPEIVTPHTVTPSPTPAPAPAPPPADDDDDDDDDDGGGDD
jgi:hypothetical protein